MKLFISSLAKQETVSDIALRNFRELNSV